MASCLTGSFGERIEKSSVQCGANWVEERDYPADIDGLYWLNIRVDFDGNCTSASVDVDVFYLSGVTEVPLLPTTSFTYGISSTSLNFSHNGPANGRIYVRLTGQGVADIILKGDCNEPVTPSDPTQVFEETCLVVMESCPCPLYVRFALPNGSYRYWEFNVNKINELAAERNNVQNLYKPFLSERDIIKIILNTEASQQVTVKAKYLTEQMYESLKPIASSGQVDMLVNPETWQSEGAIWKGLLVTNAVFRDKCKDPINECEVTFTIPETNTVNHAN